MTGLVTVFGASGFVGRYVVRDLLRAGWRVRVAERDPRKALFLKPQASLGQIQFMAADVRRADTVARAVAGADAVINLVGVLAGDFTGVQAEGAENVARLAKASGVKALVHMSSIGADVTHKSHYGSSKGEGEALVRKVYPQAVILRPSVIFGAEDTFTNRFAGMLATYPVVPVARGWVKFQPIYVADVAAAVLAALEPEAAGKTFELGGPDILTMTQLQQWLAHQIDRYRLFVDMPDMIMAVIARLTGWMPGAPVTWDQWLMLDHDNVVSEKAKTLADLGVNPTPMDAVAATWLVKFRKRGRFITPEHITGVPA